MNDSTEPGRAESAAERKGLAGNRYFVTTHWSVVLAAGQSDSTRAQVALSSLCQTYWYPLYAFVRQRGHPPHDAQDLVQAFFAHLLEQHGLVRVTRDKGKFRSFLLTALKHFLVDEWKKARRAKRGAGQVISLDAQAAESRFALEPADPATPEKLFEQNWALTLLDTVLERLRAEQQAAGRGSVFAELKSCLTGERSAAPYAALAQRLQIPENTVKTLVRRLRQRYRELLRAEVAQTVADPAEVEEELRALFRALGG